jgi:peptidoglycan/LPS O-acetylase OafA/YrhL
VRRRAVRREVIETASGDAVPLSGRMLGAHVAGRDNNFNLIRMVAATGVLVSHAFPISLGPGAVQPLDPILGLTLGTVSVYVFFAVSGFLIARSFERSGSLGRFWKARVLRIFPGLAVVLAVTLVAGAFASTAPLAEYARAAVTYFLRNLTLFALQYDLPGVFAVNPYGPAINGSLWTLSYEVLCYAGVMGLGLAGLLQSGKRAGLAFLAFLAFYAAARLAAPHPRLVLLAELALPFMLGTLLHAWRDRVPLSFLPGAGLAALALLLHGTPLFREAFVVALTYWVFLLAYLPRGAVRTYNRLGDFSYGTYIYAFPVQQIVAALGIADPFLNIALALPLTLVCAILSWTLVEKPALALAHRGG